MGLTIFLLDEERKLRQIVRSGIAELIHSEADGELTAELAIGYKPRSGEHIAMRCVDGRDRLFEIDIVDQQDEEGVDYIEAQDAAVAELRNTIAVSAAVRNKSARQAMETLLAGTGWQLGLVEADGHVGNIRDAEYEPISDVMERIADTANVKLVPYYELTEGKVTGRRIDMLSREPVYRGLIISRRNASDIVLTEQGAPMGRVYALGGWTGTGDDRRRVTLESVAWSTAAGDPTDKPAGQAYIDMPDAKGAYRRAFVYEDANETDPLQLAENAYKALQERSKAKQTGTARAADLFFMGSSDGRAHVQVDDYAGLRSRSGVREERIANILRDYVRPELTELEFGERQSKNWIQYEMQQQAYNTDIKIGRIGGGLSSLSDVVEDNGAELYRAIEEIVELGEGTATRFNEVWIDLDAQRASIDLVASSATKLGDSLLGKLSVQAGWIEARVEKNGVIAAINLSTEKAVIDAERIDLQGYVTAEAFDTKIANINKQWSEKVATWELEIGYGMSFQGHAITRRSKTVLTALPEFLTATITHGNGNQTKVVTGWADAPTRSTLFYLGDAE